MSDKKNKYDIMNDYLESVQDDIFELARIDCCEYSLNFIDSYKKIHCYEINTNVLELFDSDELDGIYFFSIPDCEMGTYKNNLDEYPIYYADFAQGEIMDLKCNFKMFMQKLLKYDDVGNIKKFSDKIMHQQIPKINEI
jgi:hypothetical protein